MDLQGRKTIHVECIAHVCNPEDATSMKSNVFNFTFGMHDDASGSEAAKTLPTVVPSTEAEARRIINRMHLDRLQADEDRDMFAASKNGISNHKQ